MLLTLMFDPKSKLGIGASRYVDFKPDLGENEIECTTDQFASPQKWKLGAGNEIVAASAAELAPKLSQLVRDLVFAASTACDALTRQVVPDQVHQNAYVNAAAMVGPSAIAPNAEPAKSAFAAMASSFGLDAAAFASMVVAIAAVSWQLQAAQATISRAASSATDIGDLRTALVAFEEAMSGIVAAVKSAGIEVVAPGPIAIAGL